MKTRAVYQDFRMVGEQFSTRVLTGIEVVSPEEISIEEFNMLNEHEQKMYILEHEEFRAWMGR